MPNILRRAEITLTPGLSRGTGRGGERRSVTNKGFTVAAGRQKRERHSHGRAKGTRDFRSSHETRKKREEEPPLPTLKRILPPQRGQAPW
jgi:hypothetical protein